MRRAEIISLVAGGLLILTLGACTVPWSQAEEFEADLECGLSPVAVSDLAEKHHGIIEERGETDSGGTLVRVYAPHPVPGLERFVHREFLFYLTVFVDGRLEEAAVWDDEARQSYRTVLRCTDEK